MFGGDAKIPQSLEARKNLPRHVDFLAAFLSLRRPLYVNRTDTELLALCQAGDAEAFAEMVERYRSVVWSVALSRTGDRSLSEDVAQETFLCAWRRSETLSDPTKLRSWLCSIARNLSATAMRRRGPIASSEASALRTDATDESVLDTLLSLEEEQETWKTLESLPESYREVLILYYREERSTASVSKIIGISARAVHQRLSRGRSLMKDRLQGAEQCISRAVPPRTLGPALALAIVSGAGRGAQAGALASSSSSSKFTLLNTSILKGLSMKLPAAALAAALLLVLSIHHKTGFSKGPGGTGQAPTTAPNAKGQESIPKPAVEQGQPAAASVTIMDALRGRLMRRVATTRAASPEGRLVLPSVRQALGAPPDPVAEFMAAREIWREEKLAEAIPELQLLVENYPEHEVAPFAANMLFDSLITEGPDAAELFYWSDLYSSDEALVKGRPDLAERLARIRVVSLRQMAEEWEAAGDFQGCYLSYQSILEALPDAQGRDEMLYNAALCAEQAELETEARQAWTELAAAHPDSPLAATARARLG